MTATPASRERVRLDRELDPVAVDHPPVVKILFVYWDGPGTAYHETTFLPLLAEARSRDDEIFAPQFTWSSLDRSARNRRLAAELGLGYEAYEIVGDNDPLRVGAAPSLEDSDG